MNIRNNCMKIYVMGCIMFYSNVFAMEKKASYDYEIIEYQEAEDKEALKELFSNLLIVPWLMGTPGGPIANQSTIDKEFEQFTNPEYKTMLARDKKNKPIGCINYSIPKAYIWFFFTHPEYQRQGIGAALFNYCLDDIKKHNATTKTVGLQTSTDNESALPFYRKFGFTFPVVQETSPQLIRGTYSILRENTPINQNNKKKIQLEDASFLHTFRTILTRQRLMIFGGLGAACIVGIIACKMKKNGWFARSLV
jgi:ribosomal protein S18 acetylase RimI-like enzyme